MPYNGSGTYSLPVTTFSPAVGNTTIDSAAQNTLIADIKSALSSCIVKDGQTTITANLPMATFRHTGVGNANALTTYASADDVIDNTLLYAGASAAGTDTYAVSLPINPVAYKAGQFYAFLTDVANTGACTVNFNAIGAKSIKLANGNDPETGDIQIGMVIVMYDGTNMQLINPSNGGLSASQFLRSDSADTATGSINFTGGISINGVAITASAAELNDLAGNAVDAADFTKLASITGTAARINELTGSTVTATELNNLSGTNTGDQTNISGNAGTATNWASASTITLTGDVTASATNINGTTNASLSTSLAANSVKSSEIDFTVGTSTSATVGVSGWVIPEGLFNFTNTGVNSNSTYLEIFVSAAWRRSSAIENGGCVWSDGTNMRLINTSGNTTIYYQVIA